MSKKIKSRFDLGRNVRNFMDEEELEIYKRFLPENKMATDAFEFAVLEEIEFMNNNNFKPSVAALADPLNTGAEPIEIAVNALQRKGFITGRERFAVTERGRTRVLAGPGAGRIPGTRNIRGRAVRIVASPEAIERMSPAMRDEFDPGARALREMEFDEEGNLL